ncbi:MAG: hypothetical protein JWN50_539, partial [Parcubacteria group bacterium]|nr:hypothetical protein [Parcubacteria group bacterium]
MNNYTLNKPGGTKDAGVVEAVKKLLPLMKDDKAMITFAMIFAFATSGLNLVAPVLIGRAV